MQIKLMREKQKLTQVELAAKLGVKQSTVCMWETGKAKPLFENLFKLAEILKVDPQQILDCFKNN